MKWAARLAAAVWVLAGVAAAAEYPQELKELIGEKTLARIDAAPLSQAHWGIMVMDLATGEEVFNHEGDKLFMPASNRKIFTTSFALDQLGSDFKFRTTVERDGDVSPQGALQGNLVVRTSGDPTISGRFRSDSSATGIFNVWAQSLERAGIKRIDGDLVVDASCYSPTSQMGEGWQWDYMSSYYAAPVGAFSFNENVAYVQVRPGAAGEACRVSIYPDAECIKIDNRTRTGGGSNSIQASRDADSDTIVVTGQFPSGGDEESFRVAVRDPTLFAADSFAAVLRSKGIAIGGKVKIAAAAFKAKGPTALIAEYESPTLAEIIKEINRSSNNLLAEMVYLAAGRGKAQTGAASYARSQSAEQQFWRTLKLQDASRLYSADGSGLSRRNLFTPRSVCEMLRDIQMHPEKEAFTNSLAVNGQTGTLSGRLWREPYAQRVLGKTGSIANVSCLSGYLIDRDDRTLVFSILVNHFTCDAETIKSAQDALCQMLIDMPNKAGVAAAGAKAAKAGS